MFISTPLRLITWPRLWSALHNTSLAYGQWLPQWTTHLKDVPSVPRVCASACKIHTPLKFKSWQYYLQTHPNQDLVHFFLDGISQGFRIGFNSSTQSLHSAHKTLQGVTLHPEIVYEYLQNKLALNRVCGPYLRHQCSMVQVSRFSVIPKSHQPNK